MEEEEDRVNKEPNAAGLTDRGSLCTLHLTLNSKTAELERVKQEPGAAGAIHQSTSRHASH